jgi:trk system potassium uptake protein TrkA
MLEGAAMAVGFKVPTTSPLLRAPLKDLPDQDLLASVRFMALLRGNELIIPNGNTRFMIGDDVYVTFPPQYSRKFMEWACPDTPSCSKGVIAGGGDLGYLLARSLEGKSVQVVILECDGTRAEEVSGLLDRALVMKGSAQDTDLLEQAGLNEEAAFVAVTGDDENNIISCLVAEQQGARFTVAQVTRPEYVPIINNLSLLDRAVSPHLSMINAILHFVHGRHVRHATLFHNLPGELIDVVMPEACKWAGKPIHAIRIPKGAILASVSRRGEIMIPTGDLVLEPGDRLAIFSLPKTVEKVEAVFQI